MHRILASGQTSPLLSLAMSWTVTAKAEKAGLLACAAILPGFFPSGYPLITPTVKSRLPYLRLQRRHRTGLTPVSLFTGPERPTLIPYDILRIFPEPVNSKCGANAHFPLYKCHFCRMIKESMTYRHN